MHTRLIVTPALLLGLLGGTVPALGAERYWVTTGGCAQADWFGPLAGGPVTCWSAVAGGPPGASPPIFLDSAHILRGDATATFRVPFASPLRGTPVVLVNSLLMQGSASFAAGLTMDRGTLQMGELSLGRAGQAGLGLLELSGGTLQAQKVRVHAGDLRQSGGSLNAGAIEITSDAAAARLTSTGGSLQVGSVRLGSEQGLEASWHHQGGSVVADAVTVGVSKVQTGARWTVASPAATTVNGALVVGGVGPGRLELQAGAQVLAGLAVLGQQPDSVGELVLADGAVLDAATVTVGGAGRGEVTLNGSGRLDTPSLVLGDVRGSEGRIVVTGADTGPSIGRAVIGRDGLGHMTLATPSASLTSAMFATSLVLGERATGDGTLLLDRTSIWLGGSSGVVVGEGGQGRLELLGGGLWLDSGPLVVGSGAGGQGHVTVSGRGSFSSIAQAIDIGRQGRGTLEVLDGAVFSQGTMPITLGAEAGGRGELVIQGSNSRIDADRVVATGAGAARLRLGPGGLLNVFDLAMGPRATLELDGGTVWAGRVALGTLGTLDWRSGTLAVFGSTALDGVQLPRTLVLSPGRSLQFQGRLTLGAGSTLTLAGGALLTSATVRPSMALQAGSRLEAQGTLAWELQGAGDSWIQATGPLVLGDAARTQGFAHAGVLWVGGAAVELKDADAATLGVQTRVTDGGRLGAPNGLWLPAGGALVGEGRARVEGALRNDGEVLALSGVLSFAGLAGGEGSWAGDLRFEAGFDPGDRQVDRVFGGGDLEIAAGGWLQLDIVSPEPRLGHDQLSEIGTLTLDGTLRLVFDPGFAADTGARLQLLSFRQFAGQLDASEVQILGLPAWRVDWSSLPVDGSIAIAAVPEPAAAWLLAAGGALLWARRRRQMSSANSPVCVGGRSKP